jgi:hypothetical protein
MTKRSAKPSRVSSELTFQGKEYPFRVEEISVSDMGISRAKATGNVYHLTKIEDFSGPYMARQRQRCHW